MNIFFISLIKLPSFLKVKKIHLYTIRGQLTIMNNFRFLITPLETGILAIRVRKKWICLFIHKGIAKINSNNVTVLASTVKYIKTINITKAQKKVKDSILRIKGSETKKDRFDAIFKLKKAIAYLKAAHYLSKTN